MGNSEPPGEQSGAGEDGWVGEEESIEEEGLGETHVELEPA